MQYIEENNRRISVRCRTFVLSETNNLTTDHLMKCQFSLRDLLNICSFYQKRTCWKIIYTWRYLVSKKKRNVENLRHLKMENRVFLTWRTETKKSINEKRKIHIARTIYVRKILGTVLKQWLKLLKMRQMFLTSTDYRRQVLMKDCFAAWKEYLSLKRKCRQLKEKSHRIFLSFALEKWRKKWYRRVMSTRRESQAVSMYQFICIKEALLLWQKQYNNAYEKRKKANNSHKHWRHKVYERSMQIWYIWMKESKEEKQLHVTTINFYYLRLQTYFFKNWRLARAEAARGRARRVAGRAWRRWRAAAVAGAERRAAVTAAARRAARAELAGAAWRALRATRARALHLREAAAARARHTRLRPALLALRAHVAARAQRRAARARLQARAPPLEALLLRPLVSAWARAARARAAQGRRVAAAAALRTRRLLRLTFCAWRRARALAAQRRARAQRLARAADACLLARWVARWLAAARRRRQERALAAQAEALWGRALAAKCVGGWARATRGQRLARARRAAVRALLGLHPPSPGDRPPRRPRPDARQMGLAALVLHYRIKVLFQCFKSWRNFLRNPLNCNRFLRESESNFVLQPCEALCERGREHPIDNVRSPSAGAYSFNPSPTHRPLAPRIPDFIVREWPLDPVIQNFVSGRIRDRDIAKRHGEYCGNTNSG